MAAGTVRWSPGRRIVAGLVSAAVLTLAHGAGADTLVPPLDRVPGSKARPVPLGPGRALLGRAPGRVLAGEGIAGSGRLGRVRIYGFELAGAGSARHAIAAWRASERLARLRPRAVGIGAGGWSVSSKRQALVVWRSGADVGLVVAPGGGRLAAALGYAAFAQATLRQPGPRTAWDRVLSQVRPDGTLSKATALKAFVLAYASLPGVPITAGPRKPVYDPTAVAQWVLTYRAQLTTAQRRIVDRELGVRSGKARAAAVNFGDPGFVKDAGYQAIVDEWRMKFGTKVDPLPAGVEIVAGRTSTKIDGFADAQPQNDQQEFSPGNYRYCRIRVGADGQTADPDFRRLFLAHEVFHCYQFLFWGNRRWSGKPLWTQEGMADWAALAIDPVDWNLGGGNLATYIDTPGKSLFERSYDAVGFFAHVQDSRGDYWGLVKGTLEQTTDPQAFVAAGGADAGTFPTWGSSVFRFASKFPLAWQMIEPIEDIPGFQALEPGGLQEIVNNGVIAADPYATAQAIVHAPGADLLHIEIGGTARMHSAAGELTNLHDVWLCVTSSCTCPPGTDGAVPSSVKWAPVSALALSGEPGDGSGGTSQSYELKHFCKKQPKQPGGGGGGGGPGGGGSNGDPHLRTLDGQRYEFQALGEFVLARSTLGGFEVQARQERILDPFFSKFLSVNTQLAFRVGRARVTISRGEPLVVRVGGHRVRPESGAVKLAGGGSITPASLTDPCDELDLRWPDGSLACVWSVGDSGVAIWIYPAAHLRGHLVGLLGNFDGTTANDFRTREGRLFAVSEISPDQLRAQYRNRYHMFGESWRVRQRESLFVYGRGQGTATFTNRSFPKELFGVDRLSRGARARAEAVCTARGITDPAVFESCVLDVAATGSDAFADSAKTEEQASAISTPWRPLAGLQGEDVGPASIAVSGDGALHVAVIAEPSHASGRPGNYLETSLDAQDRQGLVSTDQPATLLQYPPLLTAGAAGLRLLGFTDTWPGGTPPGASPSGLMGWQNGAVSDWLPSAHGPATGYAETADGTPYTVTVAVNNLLLWRGSGQAAVPHGPPGLGPGCFDHSDQVASDGLTVWFAWLQINCANDSQNGIYVAPVSAATGEIGAPQQVPRPPGTAWAPYDSSLPLTFLHRPGSSGAWLAYALLVHGALHAFLLHAGDATATDLGPATSPRLLAAATPSGALWVGWFDNNTPHATWLLHFRRFAAEANLAQPGTWTVSLPALASGAQVSPGHVKAATRGERLDLIADLEGTLHGPDGGVWHTRIG